MKKLVLAATLFAATFSQKAQAQDYYHGIGAQALYGVYSINGDIGGIDISSTSAVLIPSIMYKATLGFEISRDKSFAVSSYPSLGFNLNSQGGSSLGYQLPILAELYLGDIDDKNFHFGLGFSYGAAAYEGDGGSVLGPIIGIGGQFELQDKLIGVRGTYTLGLNKSEGYVSGSGFTESRSMIGIGVYYLLGQ
jgi:hypothetical protein